MKKMILALAAVAAVIAPTAALAQNVVANIGPWEVAHLGGNICAAKIEAEGMGFGLAYDSSDGAVLVAALNAGATVAEGTQAQVAVNIDGNAFEATGTGMGNGVIIISQNGSAVISAFINAESIDIDLADGTHLVGVQSDQQFEAALATVVNCAGNGGRVS